MTYGTVPKDTDQAAAVSVASKKASVLGALILASTATFAFVSMQHEQNVAQLASSKVASECQGAAKLNEKVYFTAEKVSMSCNEVCADVGGTFDSEGSTHRGGEVAKHFYPDVTVANNWKTVECMTASSGHIYGANGEPADGDWKHDDCRVSCACAGACDDMHTLSTLPEIATESVCTQNGAAQYHGVPWFTAKRAGQSCNEVCADLGGAFDSVKSTHRRGAVSKWFYPEAEEQHIWETVECKTRQGIIYGANGNPADGNWKTDDCFVSCSCTGVCNHGTCCDNDPNLPVIIEEAACKRRGGAAMNARDPSGNQASTWFTANAPGKSCNEVCEHAGGTFDSVKSTHTGAIASEYFYPNGAVANNWKTVECSSASGHIYGANGEPADGDWKHDDCRVSCACGGICNYPEPYNIAGLDWIDGVECKGDFNEWSECNKECGGGTRTKTFIITQETQRNYRPCMHHAGETLQESCNLDPCIGEGLVLEAWENVNGLKAGWRDEHGALKHTMPGADLTAEASAEDALPTRTCKLNTFEAPVDSVEDGGERISGFFTPPHSGEYTFSLSADDGGALYMGHDSESAIPIAHINGFLGEPGLENGDSTPESTRKYWGAATRKEVNAVSEPQTLHAGTRYYISAVEINHQGRDALSVAVSGGPWGKSVPIPVSHNGVLVLSHASHGHLEECA
eukprot:SAG11_NODE_342_length_10454_cov_11.233079_6_plen_683_part_00